MTTLVQLPPAFQHEGSRADIKQPEAEQHIEAIANDQMNVEFRIDDLVRLVIEPGVSHCGGCYGCSGCSHVV